MTIEQVAGETAVGNGAAENTGGGSDIFTLPDNFSDSIDEGEVEIQGSEGAGGDSASQDGAGADKASPATAASAPTATTATTQQTGQTSAQAAAPTSQQAPAQQQPTQASAQSGQTGQDSAGGGRKIYSPAELATELGKNKTQMLDALAAEKFKLSPEEISALEVDAVGVLPKIMARVYFEATVNGLQQLANMVPRMVESVANERIAETQAEDEFHTAWPNIDKNNAVHMKTVNQLANSFRSMNPSASRADAVKFVGMAATNFLGLQMPQANSSQGNRGGGSPPRRQQPAFAPANGGRAQPLPGAETRSNEPFAGMGTHFDE